MARRDGTGPAGYGPMTGRGYGPCGDRAGYGAVGTGGFGSGYGAGYGVGYGKRFNVGRRGGFGRFNDRGYAYNRYDGETAEERLIRHKSYHEKRLELINKRLEEL